MKPTRVRPLLVGLVCVFAVVLLIVAYQLWSSNGPTVSAQDRLENDFVELAGITTDTFDAESLTGLAVSTQQSIADGQIFLNEPQTLLADAEMRQIPPRFEGAFELHERERIQSKLYPAAGDVLARIVIPSIDLEQFSVEGVSVDDLRMGPGHYRTTANPGQWGTAGIAAHRTDAGDPFARLGELTPGDAIFVTTAQGHFEYRVMDPFGTGLGSYSADADGTWVLDQRPNGQNSLVLTACRSESGDPTLIIVEAALVGEPAITIPRDRSVDLGSYPPDGLAPCDEA